MPTKAGSGVMPSRDVLRRLLDYNPATGALTWKPRTGPTQWNVRWAGKPALACPHIQGYLHGAVLGTLYLAHRIIWKWLYDTEPHKIDHSNGVRSDNRQVNLCDVDDTKSAMNQGKRSDNTSGICRVYWNREKRKWRAAIGYNGRQHFLGYYTNQNEAAKARAEAERRLGFHPNHGIRDSHKRQNLPNSGPSK